MTPYLDVQHLSKSFGALQLFRDISFSIGEGQKVGLIAKNGTGKSTLLSILSGKEGYDSGSIVFRRDLKVGMLEQSPAFDADESVLDACFNHQGDPEKVLRASISNRSNAEKYKTQWELSRRSWAIQWERKVFPTPVLP